MQKMVYFLQKLPCIKELVENKPDIFQEIQQKLPTYKKFIDNIEKNRNILIMEANLQFIAKELVEFLNGAIDEKILQVHPKPPRKTGINTKGKRTTHMGKKLHFNGKNEIAVIGQRGEVYALNNARIVAKKLDISDEEIINTSLAVTKFIEHINILFYFLNERNNKATNVTEHEVGILRTEIAFALHVNNNEGHSNSDPDGNGASNTTNETESSVYNNTDSSGGD